MAHMNIGTWSSTIRNIPPKFQIIFWREWRGVHWHRWTGGIASILYASLLLGFVELRFWRRPHLTTKVTYPGDAA